MSPTAGSQPASSTNPMVMLMLSYTCSSGTYIKKTDMCAPSLEKTKSTATTGFQIGYSFYYFKQFDNNKLYF